jgi:hypothetical protein
MKTGSKRARDRGRPKAKRPGLNATLPVPTTPRHLRTVAQFAREHDAFREPSLRWLIFNAEENGLAQAGAIVRIGRRVYLDVERFFAWVDAQQPASGDTESAPVAVAAKGR